MVSIFTPLRRDNWPIGRFSARGTVMTRMTLVLDPVAATGCIFLIMTIKQGHGITGIQRGQTAMVAGGVLAALAASSCCILPLVLFSLGVSGAWIGNFTRLAPYQPFFIALTIACLGYGYWLVYRASKVTCADGETCARPMPDGLVRLGLILA